MAEPGAPKPRVAMVCAGAFPLLGGLESHVDEVAHRLNGHHYDLTVVTVDRSQKLEAESFRHGVRVLRFPAAPKDGDYLWSSGLYHHIRESNYDLVHIQGINTLVPPTAMVAARAAGVPYLVSFHTGGANTRLRRVVRPVQFKALAPLLRGAAGLIAVSEFEADLFVKVMGRGSRRPRVIRNGSQHLTEAPREGRTDPGPGPLILSIGRLEKYKGHHRAIAAMTRVRSVVPTAKLMIIGAGPYEPRLRHDIARLGLQSQVSIDYVPADQRQRLFDLLHDASLTVLLSDFEAHPMAVIESNQTDTNVLVRENSGMAELVDDRRVFGIRNRATANETADAIIDLLFGRQSGSRSAAEAIWSWDDCASAISDSYCPVISRSRPLGRANDYVMRAPRSGRLERPASRERT